MKQTDRQRRQRVRERGTQTGTHYIKRGQTAADSKVKAEDNTSKACVGVSNRPRIFFSHKAPDIHSLQNSNKDKHRLNSVPLPHLAEVHYSNSESLAD